MSRAAHDAAAQPVWRATNAPVASSRTDDIWFRDPLRGWAVNSNGQILHTEDGFVTFAEQFHDKDVYLRCVGFASGTRGGWGSASFREGFSSSTTDGGATWHNANEIGAFINRFRFFHDPVTVGYASGRTVYRYAADPLPVPRHAAAPPGLSFLADNAPGRSEAPLQITVTVPPGAAALTINIWDRFGAHVRRLLDEPRPAAGSRTIEWDGTDDAGRPLDDGSFLIRVSVDDRSESRIMYVTR